MNKLESLCKNKCWRIAMLVATAYVFCALYNPFLYIGNAACSIAMHLYGTALAFCFLLLCSKLRQAGTVLYLSCCALFAFSRTAYGMFKFDFIDQDFITCVLETNSGEAVGVASPLAILSFILICILSYALLRFFKAVLACRVPDKKVTPFRYCLSLACVFVSFLFLYIFPSLVVFKLLEPSGPCVKYIIRNFSDDTLSWYPFYKLDYERPPYEHWLIHYRRPFGELPIIYRGLSSYFSCPDPFDSAACNSVEENENKDLIVVLAIGESIRADHMGFNGYSRATTPELGKIANLYPLSKMYSFGSVTFKSFRAIMTGAISEELPQYRTSFLSILKKHGYRCSYWMENAGDCVLSRIDKLIVGDFLDEKVPSNGTIEEVAADFAASLPASGKHCIVFQNGTGHYPYEHDSAYSAFSATSDNEDDARMGRYDNCVLAIDSLYAKMIHSLQDKNAVLIFCSDHGELLGEDGKWHHGDGTHPILRQVASFIWFSDTFVENNQDLVNRFVAAKDKPLVQGQVFASILKVCGISTEAPLDIGDFAEDSVFKHPENNLPPEIKSRESNE